ncbi:MAG: hypothetical protein R3F31_28280 [Verrucomicrobiales bacterium]
MKKLLTLLLLVLPGASFAGSYSMATTGPSYVDGGYFSEGLSVKPYAMYLMPSDDSDNSMGGGIAVDYFSTITLAFPDSRSGQIIKFHFGQLRRRRSAPSPHQQYCIALCLRRHWVARRN